MEVQREPRRSWIEETFYKRDCVRFIPASQDLHRCCCGRLMAEHCNLDVRPRAPPLLGARGGEVWSVERHTQPSPTDAFGTIDFQDSTRSCRAKYIRLSSDAKEDQLLQLMLNEWHMALPKLIISVHGGTEDFHLPPRVWHAFGKGLVKAAETTGAWILTEGINKGMSKYVGEAAKKYGAHDFSKKYTVGIAPWGIIENDSDLIGKDVIRSYQTLGNPLSKRLCLNSHHSHFLLVDDGTVGKYGCELKLRRKLEGHIRLQKIHPRLSQAVPVLCVVLEGGPGLISLVLEYVKNMPPIPVIVYEGTGRAADLLAFVHKQTATDRQLDPDIQKDVLQSIQKAFGFGKTQSGHILKLLMECMNFRDSITVFDLESEEQTDPDTALLTALLKGTKETPPDQLSIALAWDRVDIAKNHILVAGRHWQVGSLEQAMLDALVMDHVSFVKLLIENGMAMNRFLTVARLEELYNTQGPTNNLLRHLVEDVKQNQLPVAYWISLIDIGLVIEYLIGGAYRSTYTRKHFRAFYNGLRRKKKEGWKENLGQFNRPSQEPSVKAVKEASLPSRLHFFRTAQPFKNRDTNVPSTKSRTETQTELSESPLFFYSFNDLFVWAVLMRRQEMALFLWQHGEEAMARAVVACKLYRTMAHEARQTNLGDSIAEELKTCSLEFGQLAVDLLENAFKQNERMAMKLLTYEMKDWSNFTCLQMAVSSGLRPFVSHTCTQMLLTDLWMGRLNMRKNSWFKIVLSILLPPAILMLEFKTQAEMSHVPQLVESHQFGRDTGGPDAGDSGNRQISCYDAERGSESSNRESDIATQGILWKRKVYEFYSAPVVKFWFHTMAYLAFLMLYSYTVLVKMKPEPSAPEWVVIFYIIATAVEKVREVIILEPRKLSKKLKVWFSEYWNFTDFVAILLFLVGFGLRCNEDPLRTAGRITYCLDIIFWYVRLLDLFAVNQHAGPYLTMISKMTANMFYIVVMMAIVLLSFGVSRKAILSPDQQPSWTLAKDVVFQPYWMIFGEVYADEIDACAEEETCVPGAFITPFLQAVYLFFQYIIMVNTLIAFFNNVYYTMKSMTNKLWKYNRYRYIMTYQEKPWLPPPLIFLNHMTMCISSIHRHQVGRSEQEKNCGLKLYLCREDIKKLHDFEEKCVLVYFNKKNEDLHCSEANRIRVTRERAEEMSTLLQDVAEKVHFIKDTLQSLDSQLGKLQDMSALAVDALTVISANDSLQVKETLLGQRWSVVASCRQFPHSWSHVGPVGPGAPAARHKLQKQYRSTPPSLLRRCRPSLDWRHTEQQDQNTGVPAHSEEASARFEPSVTTSSDTSTIPSLNSCSSFPHLGSMERMPFKVYDPSQGPQSRFASELSEAFYAKPWICDSHLPPSQEDSMEEEEEGEVENQQVLRLDMYRASSEATLLDSQEERGSSGGCVNPAFSMDDESEVFWPEQEQPGGKFLQLSPNPSSLRHCRHPRNGHHHSSSSEGFGSSSKRLQSSLSGLERRLERNSWAEGQSQSLWARKAETPFSYSKHRELSRSSEIYFLKRPGCKRRVQNRKPVKIQLREKRAGVPVGIPCGNPGSGGKTNHRHWSASASLTQLNLESQDLAQRCAFSCQASLAASPWNSGPKSNSGRSSLQRGIGLDVKGATFRTADDLHAQYSAVERNNLMRLAHTILFAPGSLLAGEEVSIYCLEETAFGDQGTSVSSWSQQGSLAMLQPLCREAMDGGLRRAMHVVCTWAERDVLEPGAVYIVKAFRPEVVKTWQKVFQNDTHLQLCLREIQQQRAAQKLMNIFNHVKPLSIPYSPRFLNVSLLHWHSDDKWLTIERNMVGDFRKYNNNTGEEISPRSSLEETILAFSHWTYQYSRGELLVLDLQGVGMGLTDPSVIRSEDESSDDDMVFGPANLGDKAIQSFVRKHTCNSCCRKLHLTDLKDSDNSTGKLNLRFGEESTVMVTRL